MDQFDVKPLLDRAVRFQASITIRSGDRVIRPTVPWQVEMLERMGMKLVDGNAAVPEFREIYGSSQNERFAAACRAFDAQAQAKSGLIDEMAAAAMHRIKTGVEASCKRHKLQMKAQWKKSAATILPG